MVCSTFGFGLDLSDFCSAENPACVLSETLSLQLASKDRPAASEAGGVYDRLCVKARTQKYCNIALRCYVLQFGTLGRFGRLNNQ